MFRQSDEGSVTKAPASDSLPATLAWRDFCPRIEALGERVPGDDFPGDSTARAEGIAHLVHPILQPNQDNVYHHASIDPSRRYRIRRHMHGCEDFALTLRAGCTHMPVWGTRAVASQRQAGRGLPAPGHPGAGCRRAARGDASAQAAPRLALPHRRGTSAP